MIYSAGFLAQHICAMLANKRLTYVYPNKKNIYSFGLDNKANREKKLYSLGPLKDIMTYVKKS